MTEQFYQKLIPYINAVENATEKQLFWSCLQKRKLNIRGFRSLKDAPVPLAASYFARNEQAIIDSLKDVEMKYDSIDEAIADFKTGNITQSIPFLLKNQENLEEKITPIFNMSIEEQGSPKQDKVIAELHQKNAELKNKLQTYRSECIQLKKENTSKKKENEKLQGELAAKEETIEHLIEEISALRKEVANKSQEIHNVRKVCRERIQLLEKENEELKGAQEAAHHAPILVLLKEKSDISYSGVHVRTYDYIQIMTEESAIDFSEILYVVNDMPVAMKFKLHRIAEACKRIRTFSTNHELKQYIQEGRT